VHRCPEDSVRLAERCLFADDDFADCKVLVEGDVLQPLEQVRLAGPEVTTDQQARELASATSLGIDLAEVVDESFLHRPLISAQVTDRISVGNAGPERFDRAALRQVHDEPILTMGA
jgi:hypothetical protein